jgi:SAM-dependent MidA family methyltransferase
LPPPDAAALARSARLEALVGARIRAAGGWISFADYMQLALYEPGLGYYDGVGSKFGAQGDFVTAPEISPLFARALAAQVAQALGVLAPRVLEFGAGTGALAGQLLRELERRGMPAQYFILEVSADLRARQQERLAGLPVTWLERLPQGFEGVVLANEVLDVLPVHLFVWTGQRVLERGVQLRRPQDLPGNTAQPGGTLQFATREAPPWLARRVADMHAKTGPWPDGYGAEVCPLAGAWLEALARSLQRGLVLLLDYGFPRAEYYHAQRAMGTLMCHYRQHAHADPLWLPGLNDITAHVDFTACARAAQRAGLQVLGYTSQAHFLLNCGLLDLALHGGGAPDPALLGPLQRLVSEAEMGELVKVLALGRGALPAPLTGFARGDRRHRLGLAEESESAPDADRIDGP